MSPGMPGYRPLIHLSALTYEEKELKRWMQTVLIQAEVLKDASETAWNDYATRCALQGFPTILEYIKANIPTKAEKAQAPPATEERKMMPLEAVMSDGPVPFEYLSKAGQKAYLEAKKVALGPQPADVVQEPAPVHVEQPKKGEPIVATPPVDTSHQKKVRQKKVRHHQ